jgi:uncharacterized HAD superfamily protein
MRSHPQSIAPTRRFCIDIDNVIASTDEVMRRIIAEFTVGRVDLKYDDVVTFNYYECRDAKGNRITKDEWRQVHDHFSETQNIMSIEPMPGAVQALGKLVEHGTVHLVTSRLSLARKATIDWLDQHKFPESCDLHFLKHGEKHVALKGFTAAVEDDYDQAVGYVTIGETPCYLIRHPWNRSRAKLRDVIWADGWAELTDMLIALAQPHQY